MSKIKIIIKCDGFYMRTNDLSMAEGAVDHLVRFGVMNHTWFPNNLIDKSIKFLTEARDLLRRASSMLASKEVEDKTVKDKAPEASTWTIKETIKEEKLQLPEQAKEAKTKASEASEASEADESALTAESEPKTKEVKTGFRKHISAVRSWTVEEDKLVCDLSNESTKKVVKNKVLRAKHTVMAIRTRLSVMRTKAFDRLSPDRAAILQAYTSGKKVTNDMVNIKRKKLPGVFGSNKGKIKLLWTKDEDQRLIDNRSLSAGKLAELFPGRTIEAVKTRFKRIVGNRREGWKELTGRPKNIGQIVSSPTGKRSHKTWGKDERRALELNINMPVAKLMELPWLKDRTRNQIYQQKHVILKKMAERRRAAVK